MSSKTATWVGTLALSAILLYAVYTCYIYDRPSCGALSFLQLALIPLSYPVLVILLAAKEAFGTITMVVLSPLVTLLYSYLVVRLLRAVWRFLLRRQRR